MAKLNYEIEFHPEAIREIREAVQWYRERNDEVATEFRNLVESAEELVQRSPESWASYLLETRGFRFQKFPFVLAYVIRGQQVFIVALAHTKRKPGYWRDRLEL
ncbi:MAG: type II toxin-antitoxin system RelE/ParE family toxin [Pirellulaceae bacterium]